MRSSDLAFPPRLGGSADSEGHATLGTTLDAYRRATFSLQPAGDDPARKGILDSLTCGCIPVLFYEQQAALWPLHWRDWAPQASVLLPHEAVLNGSLDVMRTLAAIPHERVALIRVARRTIGPPTQPTHDGVCQRACVAREETVRVTTTRFEAVPSGAEHESRSHGRRSGLRSGALWDSAEGDRRTS